MTPSGIEPATFRFVVLCLNHCATAVLQANEVLRGEKPVKISIYAPQISRGLGRNRNRASKVRGPSFKGRKSKKQKLFPAKVDITCCNQTVLMDKRKIGILLI